MNDTSIDTGENAAGNLGENASGNPHADKYNDPRAKITRRGILIGVAVLVLGILGAAGSIYARRTHLVETTEFWGEETITALQLAERMELLPRGDSEFEIVELTATPGLGHLRHALLESTHFDWSTETEASVAELCQPSKADAKLPQCVQIRLSDPTANRVGTIEIDIDLEGGWVGPSDGSKRVQATYWVKPKLRNYLATILTVQQKRYDHRD
ncbi:MAG: hypothetical protein AB8B91_11070 [Rubripirellula sp.]